MPEYPIKPSRKKVVALGFFLALAAAAGIVVLLEVIFARVWGVNSLTAVTGLRPMVVIPYITTTSELHATQVLRMRLIALSAGLVLVGLVLIHTLVVPLHTLLISVFSRLD